ncbi:MAG TPA: exodeoxyribonuclease VII small subunit [Myxococcota bacterium]|nr:exodeoxyribonuclease VII small subunit [Myxococcota bacterium]
MDEDSPSAKLPPASTDELPFETALTRLEGIVQSLEKGDLELEAALAAFEQGIALSRHCATQLERAERRIEVLVREGAGFAVRPFAGPEDAD